MRIHETAITGCYEIAPDRFKDERGLFVKTFRDDFFADNGLETRFAEQYYSFSYRHVIRGLHFQTPPWEHVKLVYCVSGNVTDAVVDLRSGSPTYGRFAMLDLSADKGNMLYIPAGLAHGFCVRSQDALLVYNVSTSYSPLHDKGIRWDSAGIPWPVRDPVVSDRDRGFPGLDEFASPFAYPMGGVDRRE
ncbi:dTDP-4-dehydrorhamnose 3,5-epimerase [Paenibacillus sp. MBLB4367]|uniref:dTDP-4-dehydrorhamnose 3,5-epimerase n=1 Tax=Paenibacillus sp. MBLB4367 TaxID=3384767 RepID=UPI0039084593